MDNFSNNLTIVRSNKRYLGLSSAEFLRIFPVSEPVLESQQDDDLCVLIESDEEPIEEEFCNFNQVDRGERIHLAVSAIFNLIVLAVIGIDQFFINLPAEPIEYTARDIHIMRLEYFRQHGFPNGYPKETKQYWENFYGETFDWEWKVDRDTYQY